MPGVVDGLQGHAPGEGAVTDNGRYFVVIADHVASQGHAQGGRDTGGSMARTKVVKLAFAPLEVARYPVFLAQGVEVMVATGDQLVGIGLVAHIPGDFIAIEVEGLIQRQGQLHHPQPRAQVPPASRHGFQMLFANLASHVF